MLWLAFGPFHAMESQVLVIRIRIPNRGAVDWTVSSGPQLLFRDVLVSVRRVCRPSEGRGAPRAASTAPRLLPGPGLLWGGFAASATGTDASRGHRPGTGARPGEREMLRGSPALSSSQPDLVGHRPEPPGDHEPSPRRVFLKCLLEGPWPDSGHGFPLSSLNSGTSRKGKPGSRTCHVSSQTRCRSF